jgi:acetylornithine deacetylase/succinyl-diaminopimelate desuccinylase family protein
MTPAEREALCRDIDRRHADQVRFLAELVKVPSDNPPGDCRRHAERTAELLERLGFEVERHPVPEAEVRAVGMLSVVNLVVRHRFGPGPTVALNAHGDVVPPGDGWSSDPYGADIREGWMYGRGVAVSKSDFATYAYALLALKNSGLKFGGTIELHLTYDEETGGAVGPEWILAHGLSRPDCAISAGFSYSVVTAHNGVLHLEVTVKGKSAHAARPETGHDALEAATRILAALYAHREGLKTSVSKVAGIGHANLVVGLIKGGINTNVVPDAVTFRLDRRVIPEENPDSVESELTEVIRRARRDLPGTSIDVSRVLLARPLSYRPGQEKLVAVIRRHAKVVFGVDIPEEGVPIYTDARLYSAAGIPTVAYGAGPRTLLEANGHRADERLRLEDLRKATQVVALAVADLLSPS